MHETVNVALPGRSYDVVIGPGLIHEAGALVGPLLRRPKVTVISDKTVAGLHLDALRAGLSAAGIAMEALALRTALTFEKANAEAVAELRAEGVNVYAWSDEDLQAFRDAMRLDGTVTDDRALHALEAAMYEWAQDQLVSRGYVGYEISNWARPGFECRHNSGYWTGVQSRINYRNVE